jgi:hypothetical protein
MVVLGFDKLVQKGVSLDNHKAISTLKLRASARKFKTEVVYQFAGFRSSEALNFCASARKLKAKETGRGWCRNAVPTRNGASVDAPAAKPSGFPTSEAE